MREQLKSILSTTLGPLYEPLRDLFWKVFALDQKTSLAWVATFVLISWGFWALHRRDAAAPTGERFWRYLFPKSLYLHPSAVADYKFFVLNKVIFLFVFGSLSLASTTVSDAIVPVLGATLGRSTLEASALTVNVAFSLASMVAFDFAYFVAHWIMHKWMFMWEFHRLHHAAEVLTPVTNYREHPVDSLFQALLQGSMVGLVTAGFLWAFPSTSLLTVAGINVFYFPYYFASNLRHSQVALSYGPVLDRIFSSPVQHQVHHGSKPEHHDVNFGIFLSLWDTLAGTLYLPKKGERIVYGVSDMVAQDYPTLWKMYALPFARAARRLIPGNTLSKPHKAAKGEADVAAQPPEPPSSSIAAG